VQQDDKFALKVSPKGMVPVPSDEGYQSDEEVPQELQEVPLNEPTM
jgi:hypothetical protein